MTDSRFDLVGSAAQFDASTPDGWNLPPNPCTVSEIGRQVAVRGSMKSTDNGTIKSGVVASGNKTLAGYLLPTNDFTVEGWARVDSFDTSVSSWRIIMQGGDGSNAMGGWTISLRNANDGKGYYLNFFAANLNVGSSIPTSGDKYIYKFIDGNTPVQDADIIGSWHHYALVFTYNGPTAGKSRYQLFFDGLCRFTYEVTTIKPEQMTNPTARFDLGGRTASANPRLVGAFSYWRVSDETLTADRFLNAGGTGSTVDPDPEGGTKTVLSLECGPGDNQHWVDTGTKVKGTALTNCTFETWVYPRALSVCNLLSQFSGADYRSTWTLFQASDGRLHQRFSMYDPGAGAWIYFDSEYPVRLNRWSHLALVIADDEWRFYVDGKLDTVRTGCSGLHLVDAGSTCDGVVIGNQRLWATPPVPNGTCNAMFSEARVWSRARTGEEIAANWMTRISKPWLEPNLIGYLPLDDGTPAAEADGQCARNCANIDVEAAGKSVDPELYIQSSVKKGMWTAVNDLPLTNSAPANRAVIRTAKWGNIQTNSVDSLVKDVANRFTFTGWYLFARRGSVAYDENCIFSKALAGNGRFHLREHNGTVTAWFGGGSDGATNEQLQVEGIGPKMPLGKWTHVAFVRNGHFARLYLNGELAGEGGGFTLPFQDTATYEFGGFNAGGSTGGFTGRFCEIGLWQQAFTAEEVVQAMYARPAGTERMLLGYWPMDDGEGDSLRNIKVGGVSAQPVETTGNFDWVPCGNIPALDGTMVFPPPPGTLILAK